MNKKTQQGQTLSATEAASYLGITTYQLKRYRLKGGGPTFFTEGVGGSTGRPRYRVSKLNAWLESRPEFANSEEAGLVPEVLS